MTNELQAANDQLQQQVDELSGMVDLLQRAVAALQVDAPAAPAPCDRLVTTCESTEPQIGPRDLHPSVPLTEGTRRHLLKLAGGAAVAAVAGAAMLDRAHPAAATTNDPMVLGNKMRAANMTRIVNGSGANVVDNPLTTEKALFWADNRLSVLSDAVGVRGDGRDDEPASTATAERA